MKKLSLLNLLLILILILAGCGNSDSENNNKTIANESKKQSKSQIEEPFKELNIGKSQQYSFGTFSITGFKRDDGRLYYSITIDPSDTENGKIELNGLKYYTGESSHKLNKEAIQLSDEQYQDLLSIATDKVADIDAISLEYNGVKAKWLLDKNADSSGDVDYIDNELSQSQNNQNSNNQNNQQNQTSQQTQVQQSTTQIQDNVVQNEQQNQNSNIQVEERNLNQAWLMLEQYGREFYPEGFNLNYVSDKQVEERYSDGVWLLQAGCKVTNEYGEVFDGTCVAEVQRVNNNWEILSFEVY